MSEHRSVWLATADQPSFAPLDGEVAVDVVVVGGGITGLTTALLLQRQGASVGVLEGRHVGAGTTGHTTGKLTSQHTVTYDELIQRHGEAKARSYAEANQSAIDTVEKLVGELGADCQFTRAPAYVYATDPSQRASIEAEHRAATTLGLPATLTTDVDLPFPVEVALRFDDQAHFHAGRYVAALASAIVDGGGRIFEGTRAITVDEDGDHATVHAATGSVRAGHVVVATLLPFVDRGGFFAKATPTRAYGVAAKLRAEAPAGMHINVGSPTRSTRPWRDGDGRGLIVVGESHPTGHGDSGPDHWGELERWTRQHFDVESFEYRWSAQDYTSADRMPYVGRSPRTERTFVATGFKKWGLTNGTAAAEMLAELVMGRQHPWLEAFDATRIGDAQTVKELVKANVHVAERFVKDRMARLRAESIAHLEPGEGQMVKVDGDTVGAYRATDGTVHAVSITCTHLGCTLQWNRSETSWDCPCHGSRFSYEGEVLEGPAVRALERIEVEGPDS